MERVNLLAEFFVLYPSVDCSSTDACFTRSLGNRLYFEIKQSYPSLWKYLREGKQNGVSDRYICRHRRPWYSQEDRPPPLFICTYIGRSDKKTRPPFRFILNHSSATIANTYLALYPKPELSRAIVENHQLAKKIWRILTKIPASVLLAEGRVYGGGLHKLEPRELASVPADKLSKLLRKNL